MLHQHFCVGVLHSNHLYTGKKVNGSFYVKQSLPLMDNHNTEETSPLLVFKPSISLTWLNIVTIKLCCKKPVVYEALRLSWSIPKLGSLHRKIPQAIFSLQYCLIFCINVIENETCYITKIYDYKIVSVIEKSKNISSIPESDA